MTGGNEHLATSFIAGLAMGAFVRITWRRKPADIWSAYPALAGNFAL